MCPQLLAAAENVGLRDLPWKASSWSRGGVKDIQQDREPRLKIDVVGEQGACPFEIAVIRHSELTLAERDQRGDADCADHGSVASCGHRPERVVFTVGIEQAVEA